MNLLILAATAAVGLAPHSTPYSDGRPPVAFQNDSTVTVQFADQRDIRRVCDAKFGRPPAGMRTNACDTGERLVVPNPCSFPDSDGYAHLLCHELGHANGWPSTHGDFPIPAKAARPPKTLPASAAAQTALSSTPKSKAKSR